MASRRKTAAEKAAEEALEQETPEEIQRESPVFDTDEFTEHSDAVQALLDGIDDDEATVILYRLHQGRGHRPAYLFSRGVHEVTMPMILEALRDDYGGGTFRLEVRDGRSRYLAAKYLEVEAPKRPLPGHEQRERDAERPPERDRGGPEFDFTPLIDMIERSNAQHRDTLNMMLQAMKPEGRRDVGELVESLAALDRLRPQPQSSGMGVKDLLEAFQLFESIRGDGGGGSGSTGWDVLRSAASSFFPMLQQGMAQQHQHPALTFQNPTGGGQGAPDPAAPGASSPAPSSSTSPAGPEPTMTADAMQQQLELLLRAAASDRDPYTYASLAIDELGAVAASRLFVDPQGWAAFAAQVPAAAQYAEWFAEFRGFVREQLEELHQEHADNVHQPTGNGDADKGDADGPAAGPGGSPPHAADHGATGDGGKA